ncbi:MAG: DUF6785 family protein [Thermofilaceae archaeon]
MGQEKPAEAKVERIRVLTPPLLITVIILTIGSEIFTIWFRSLTTKMWSYTGWFIGAFYVVLIMQLLGMLSPKLRLNPGQQLLLLLPFWYAAGKAFMITGAGGENWHEMLYPIWSFLIRGLREPALRTYTWDLTPSLIAPKDLTELDKIWRGLMPGEVINWGPWMAPIAFWSLWLIVTTLIIVTLVYTVIGPQTVEVERLVYPMSVPATVLLTNAGTWVEVGGKARSKLFDLADMRMRIFWISFVVGALFLSMIPLLMEVLPVIPVLGAFLWGEIPLSLQTWFNTAAVLPGGHFYAVFIIHQAILMTLLPYDVLITPVIIWLIVYLIYVPLGVRMGFLPYTPGVEGWANWYYGYMSPFPFAAFAIYGMSLGLGLLTLWEARGTVAKALKGGVELPVKQLLYLFAGLFLVWLVLWTAAGANPVMMIYFFILFILWQISIVRYYAEIWWHPPVIHDTYYLLIWPVGAGVGAWASVPTQASQPLYIQNMALLVHGCWAAYRQSPWNMGFTAHTYKWARDLNVNLRDVMLALFAIAVVGWPVAFIFNVWWLYHGGGYVKLNEGTYGWPVDVALNQGVRGLTHFSSLLEIPFWQHGVMALIGIILVFAIYFLRMRFAWFMINPTAVAMTLWLVEFIWLAALAALIAKYLGIRIFGARRYEEYASYVAAGLCWGLGAGYIIGGFYDLFLGVLPKFYAFFVP